MEFYEEHIEHGDDVRRPYVKATGLPVHRIIDLLDDAAIPQEVVQRDNELHRIVSDLNEKSHSDIHVSESEDAQSPELTITHVEAAIEFARDHKSLIEEIQQEQSTIDTAVLSPPETAYDELQQEEFDHFDVDVTLERNDGDSVLQYDIT